MSREEVEVWSGGAQRWNLGGGDNQQSPYGYGYGYDQRVEVCELVFLLLL